MFKPSSLLKNIYIYQSIRFYSNNNYQQDSKSYFGFKSMSESEKFQNVNSVFSKVANKYDIMNDCMSLGIHRLWKEYFVKELMPIEGGSYLDVAGGTGDIAFKMLKYIKESRSVLKIPKNDATSITICDINPHMIKNGKQKCKKIFNELDQTIFKWEIMDAENLSFEDNSFDSYTISFGIRNCVHIEKVLEEAYRVLKPGGRFLCLEFGKVNLPLIRDLYKIYSFNIIPVLGHLIAGDWNSYQYLVESIEKFPSQEKFKTMIINAQFSDVTYKNLSLGIAVISSGFKI
ncbi:unnamed protein product [Gordionus sp. m RMFG-2023]|uniref:2-methoxy-6-polyprenyl-1,4-benzoquinol methylase, mitochondrial-like n=1 Tax=Gordionus sp. m RMFG-2023 TaxID=3053472 RepID=UPI0030E5A86E